MKYPSILVVLESPYAGNMEENLKYARACVKDCLNRGEAALASHLLYTQPGILDDTIEDERQMGCNAGFEWGNKAQYVVVYTDKGISKGMQKGIEYYSCQGKRIEFRSLYEKA